MGIYLSKPKTTKDSVDGECDEFRFAASSMQGWRTSMEDAHISAPNIAEGVHLFAVFDGHGGPEVAAFCAQHFVEELKANPKFASETYGEALQETFLRIDEMLQMPEHREELRKLRESDAGVQSYAGCTANVCLVTPREVVCANAGDSRALLHGAGGTLPLSKDHKPDLPGEKARIVAAGGYVSEGRVNENLNLSRAIGDLEYKKNAALPAAAQIITAFPDVKSVPRDKAHAFLLLVFIV